MTTVAIASPLEPELAARIAAAEGVELVYESELLPPARFPGDHRGDPAFERSADDERRFWELLALAEVLFGLPDDSGAGLREAVRRCPGLRWVQGTAAGAGEQVRAAALAPEELERVAVTTSSGVHAGPLAEWCLFGVLAFTKGLPRLQADRAARRWEHYTVPDLAGRTLLVLGVGAIGLETARLGRALGMRTLGVKRTVDGPLPHLDELHETAALRDLLSRTDALVVTLPLTAETEGLVGREELSLLPPGAIVVNVGRGAVVDEPALVDALQEGRLAGAALDVTTEEPPTPESPLWTLPNVLLSPHTAALSPHENERILDLFLDNLRRYRAGEPLRNAIDTERFY